MRVLSLFDGMSCRRVALERVGIHVQEYYASEIDKHAIQVSKNNYPEILYNARMLNPSVKFILESVAMKKEFELELSELMDAGQLK